MSAQEKRKELVADENRFKFLYPNSRPKMPEGYSAPLPVVTNRQLARKRREAALEAERLRADSAA